MPDDPTQPQETPPPRPLETVDTDELIHELLYRHKHMVLMGISFAVDAPEQNYTWRLRYCGDPYYLIGMLEEAKRHILPPLKSAKRDK